MQQSQIIGWATTQVVTCSTGVLKHTFHYIQHIFTVHFAVHMLGRYVQLPGE